MSRRALGLLLLALAADSAAATRMRAAVEFGLDSYVQRYRLTDLTLGADIDAPDLVSQTGLRDTTEVFSEFRTLVELALLDEDPENRVDLRARASLGTERNVGQALLEARMGSYATPGRVDVSASLERRDFHSGSDFALQSDGSLLDLRVSTSRRLREGLRAGLRVRGRQEDFDEQSEFELNERRLDLSTTWELERDLAQTIDLEFGAGWRDVPDSTQIAHGRLFALGDLGWQGSRWSFWLRSGLERREYEDQRVRSPYWDLIVEPTLSRRLGEAWRLGLRAAHEGLDYDEQTSIYFDQSLGRVGLELGRSALRWSCSAEARYGWLDAPSQAEDRYRQPSLLARFDWFGSGRLWLSLSEEFGRRDYRSDADEFDLYSDYWFLRTTLLASFRIRPWLSLDAFLSDEPESHRDAEDDGRLTLFSASLRATL